MSVAAASSMRIGEVAELTGITPRTIRYWEELGLLGPAGEREQGKHRLYGRGDVERIEEIVRLKGLLGLSLEQLAEMIETDAARAEIRREYFDTEDPERRLELLLQARPLIEQQLELVRDRQAQLATLEQDLVGRLELAAVRLQQLRG
jgi:MerR family transcriptional regulator, repressor of the yfmOP operon